jgi:hypothetical protein
MLKFDDLSRSRVVLDENNTLIGVIEMSGSSWLVAGIVPGIERQPLKKLDSEPESCSDYCIAGAKRQPRPEALSRGSPLPSKPAATVSGWRVGCGRTTSKPRSSTRPASPSRASIGVPKPIGSMPRF